MGGGGWLKPPQPTAHTVPDKIQCKLNGTTDGPLHLFVLRMFLSISFPGSVFFLPPRVEEKEGDHGLVWTCGNSRKLGKGVGGRGCKLGFPKVMGSGQNRKKPLWALWGVFNKYCIALQNCQ